MTFLVAVAETWFLFAVPWLYVKAGLRWAAARGISTTKNREHPWKLPPAELVALASALVGWSVVVGLGIVWPFS